jgi:ankyrin repeat protein
LRPIFRKDEETAWTIVASQAHSSQAFSLARSEAKWSDRDSFISDKSFAFTNDLLTAPVYRRLALKAFRKPPRVGLVSPATLVAPSPRTPEKNNIYALQAGETESLVTVARAQADDDKLPGCMINGEKSGQDGYQQDVTAIFSSCVHCDVAAFKPHHSMKNGTRLLPLHSRFRREQMTKEEEVAIDLRFVDAVKNNDVSSLGEALDLGADINATDEYGVPALLCSLPNHPSYSDILPMFLLSYKDLNVQVRDARGRTALHTSVIMYRSALVSFMLHRGAALENRDGDGNTPLHLAVGHKIVSLPCLRELIHHARLRSISLDSITNTAGMTALHVACLAENRHTAVHSVPLLLEAGCLPTIRATVTGYVNTVSPLYLAIANKHQFLVHSILQLPSHLVLVNRQHGPAQSLLALAMVNSEIHVPAACGAIVLALLWAGAEYRNIEQEIYNWSFYLDEHNRSKIHEFLWQEGSWPLLTKAETNVDLQMDSPASVDSVPVEF